MANTLLRLAYDGSAYHGWQSQKNAESVCDTVKKALKAVCQHDIALVGCGRTDAGVHAAVYAANFDCRASIPLERLPNAVNAHLPHDIAVDLALPVAEDFNAIGSCIGKRYTYRVYNAAYRHPLLHNRMYWYKHKLDVGLLRQAGECLLGTRDFKALCGAAGTTKTTVRTIRDITITQQDNIVDISVTADGFLYNMMRALVGTLLYVNEGKIELSAIPSLLEGRDRRQTGPTVPPEGLYMSGVWYESIAWERLP